MCAFVIASSLVFMQRFVEGIVKCGIKGRFNGEMAIPIKFILAEELAV